jgi:2-dehydro-3-deoxyphosphogalactonate aldolase
MTLEDALTLNPLVAILRGVEPGEIVAHGEALYAAGIRALEIPMNSPDPLDSVARAAAALGDRMAVGAGTVLSVVAVDGVKAAGGVFMVSPNVDPAVIAHAVSVGLETLPGFATASEAFAAVGAGSRRLKLFPASTYGSGHLKALKAVLPRDVGVWAVGGVGPAQMADWKAAGVAGFGLGSELYRAGQTAEDTAIKARAAVAAWAA